MIVVSASDSNFLPGLLIQIYSTWRHNRSARFYVIDAGLDEKARASLLDLCRDHGIECSILDIDSRTLANLPAPRHLSPATYARLFIPKLLPDQSRAIYLDTDIVVCADITDLWQMDLDGNLVAGTVDGMINPALLKEIGVPSDRYINAGVLLMDLDRWRREGTVEKAIDELMRHPGREYDDQTAINVVANGRIKYLGREFNFMSQQLNQLPLTKPRILHYAGIFKPWSSARAPLGRIYDGYRLASAAGIPAPPKAERQWVALRKRVLGLLALRPKYWRPLLRVLHYDRTFVRPHLQALRSRQ